MTVANSRKISKRIFSLKRAAVSFVLGFLIPLSYALLLSVAADYLRKAVPEFLVLPIGWPRPLWIFLMGRQPSETDVAGGILFMAVGNVLVYGAVVYGMLSVLPLFRVKQTQTEQPPPPHLSGGANKSPAS